MKIVINLPQHALRNKAMVDAGLDPRAMGLKPGKRVHANRKLQAAKGQCKHRHQMFD